MKTKPGEEGTVIDKCPSFWNTWDVQGTCQIKCPGVEGGWSPQGDPALTLDIYQEMRQGNRQWYDMFHFRIVEGFMRFE